MFQRLQQGQGPPIQSHAARIPQGRARLPGVARIPLPAFQRQPDFLFRIAAPRIFRPVGGGDGIPTLVRRRIHNRPLGFQSAVERRSSVPAGGQRAAQTPGIVGRRGFGRDQKRFVRNHISTPYGRRLRRRYFVMPGIYANLVPR